MGGGLPNKWATALSCYSFFGPPLFLHPIHIFRKLAGTRWAKTNGSAAVFSLQAGCRCKEPVLCLVICFPCMPHRWLIGFEIVLLECHCGCFGTSQPALCFYFKAPPRRGRNGLPAKRAVRVQESLPWRESFMCSSHFIRRVRSYFVPRMGLKLAVREEPCWGSRWSPPLRPGGFIEVHLQTFGLSFGNSDLCS